MKELNLTASSLLNFIKHDLLLNRPFEEEITVQTNLINNGIIDSLSLIQMITHLEKQAGIQIDDADVNPDNFQSVEAIIEYLKRRVLSSEI